MRYLSLDYCLKQPEILRVPSTVPTSKVPCLILDGEPIGESERILNVIEKLAAPSIYPHTFDEDEIRGTAFVRLVEDHLFFIISRAKHLDAKAAAIMWSEMLPNYHFISQWLVRKYVQGVQRRRIRCTSIGDLNEKELLVDALRDIRALAAQLNSSYFIASNSFTVYDFSVAAHIASILHWRIDNWLTSLFREHEIFYSYLDRVAKAVGGFDYAVQ